MSEGKGVVGTSSEAVGATVALQVQLGGTSGIYALTQPLGAALTLSGEPGAAGSTVQLESLSSDTAAALSTLPIDGLIFTQVDGDEDPPFFVAVEDRIEPTAVTIRSTQQEETLTNAALPPIDAQALQALFRRK